MDVRLPMVMCTALREQGPNGREPTLCAFFFE